MKRAIAAAGLALALLAACARSKEASTAPAAPESIRVGSYNMGVLGSTKAERPGTMEVLSRIGATFDLMAMQEVGSNSSPVDEEKAAKVMDQYLASVNTVAGGDLYAYFRSDQYALLYRKDRLEVEEMGLYAGASSFAYPPHVARVKAAGRPLDFILVTVHTRPSLAGEEVPAIASVMEELAAAFDEPDVLCAGDYNADGSYYDEGDEAHLAGFHPDRFITVVPNEADTTVGKAEFAYDRIQLSSFLAEDYVGDWGVLRPADHFDLSACEGPGDSAGTERALSDHYPVWAELRTDADTD